MKIVVTGGAGYIGSFMTRKLLDNGHSVLVIDSLERGHKTNIDPRADFKKINLLNEHDVSKALKEDSFDGVINFAGYISMGESMENPAIYFQNNTLASLNLLEAMRKNGIKNLIFSSTAGVYGNPEQIPIPENHTTSPNNPYGESKFLTEKILTWYNKIYKINYVALRYFNAAGASLDGSMGENHEPETHIIPLAIRAAISNSEFSIFGGDYETKDGTCVRDYIHVLDLIDAHTLALKKIHTEGGSHVYNVGTGKGHSNKEVVQMVKEVTGIDFKVVIKKRRPGDVDTLVADPTKIISDLGFTPKHSDLRTIIKTAYSWHKNEK